MEGSKVSFADYAQLVRRNRNFRLLWFAQIISEQGDWMYAVAIYSLLLQFTGSAKSIALAFVLQVLPQFFVAPSAGVINDRISRKQVMIFADWARTVIVLAMVLVRKPALLWLLYALLFLETVMWALFEPGRSAVIPNITEKSELVVANALGSATWAFNFAVGMALGGALAAFAGRDTVFILNSLSFVASALLLRKMKFTEPHAENLPPLKPKDLVDYSAVRDGIRYVWSDRSLRTTIFVKAGNGFVGANWVLLPIFGERVFPVHRAGFSESEAGMLGMSLLMACRGIGAVIGPLLGGYWAGRRESRLQLGILFGYLAGVAGYLTLGNAPGFVTAFAGVVLAQAGSSTLWVFSSTLLQLRTDDNFRGRVFSAEWAFNVIMLSLSSYSAGVLIDRSMPVQNVAKLTGLALLIPALLWAISLVVSKQRAS